jgi:hypothetical protein
MSLKRILVVAAIVLGTAVTGYTATRAANEDISPEHISAAIRAFRAAGIGDIFDRVLPILSEQTQNRLIQQRPDLTDQISLVVNDVAVKLIPRRVELDNQAARIWALAFTQEELDQVTAFFSSDVGKKYRAAGQNATQESMAVMKAWSSRISDEMNAKAREEFKKQGVDF